MKWLTACCKFARHLRLINILQDKRLIAYHAYPKRFMCHGRFLKSSQTVPSQHLVDNSPSTCILRDGSELSLILDDQQYRFHASWLRFCCQCPMCMQEHSNQRTIEAHMLPEECKLASASIEGNDVILRWQGENDHVGRIACEFLRQHNCSPDAISKRNQQARIKTYMTNLPRISYEEISASQEGFRQLLVTIAEYGCCLVEGTPAKDGTAKEICEKIAPIQRTIYGMTFDVISTPQPINIAYSTVGLGYHMDLMYYESPPGIQVLHCISFDECVTGGESMLLDSFLAVEELRRDFPDDFDSLVRIPATFQKMHFERDYPVAMRYQRPHIVLNHNQEVIAVNWSPSFEGPLSVNYDCIEQYYKAYRKLANYIEKSSHQVFHRLRPGHMLLFNNRRILHGRQLFTLNGGSRHLQGLYLNIDEFKSEVMFANHKVGITDWIPRVGNQCYS